MFDLVKRIVYPEKPDWEPLIKVLGNKCEEYMFMGKIPLGDLWIYLYKNIITRRYLNLDGRGTAYRYDWDKYVPVKVSDALKDVYRDICQ